MFQNLFGKRKSAPSQPPESMLPAERRQAIKGSGAAELAAELLIAPTALMQLKKAEALTVVSYMIPHRIAAGTTFISEGDTSDTSYMLLILEGDVTVESSAGGRDEPATVTVLGAGSLVGEMGMVDGKARMASCRASTDVRCAILSRMALEKLSEEEPRTAAKLMFAVSLRIAERLRATTEKLHMYSRLTKAMQQEIDHLMP